MLRSVQPKGSTDLRIDNVLSRVSCSVAYTMGIRVVYTPEIASIARKTVIKEFLAAVIVFYLKKMISVLASSEVNRYDYAYKD